MSDDNWDLFGAGGNPLLDQDTRQYDATVNPASTEALPAWTQEPAPVAVPQVADPELLRFKPQVDQLWSRYSSGPDPAAPAFRNLADTSATPSDVKGAGPKTADGGDSIFKSIAKWFGFSETPEGRNASSAAMTGLISAAVKGGADALFGAPKRAAEIEKLRASSEVDRAQAEAIAKKSNQAGMANLTLNQAPGLLGGFRPAPIVPIKTRTA